MDIDEYQKAAKKTAIYPTDIALSYTTLGLAGEAGEIANKVKKIIRDKKNLEDIQHDLKDELGDVLWYCAMFADAIGCNLSEVAQSNLAKLLDRKERGVIRGEGDNR